MMTLRQLSQLYYLRKEIARDEKRLAKLREGSFIPAPDTSGMPHAQGGNHSKTEEMALDMCELEAQIRRKHAMCADELARLEWWILSIDDSLTRQIFELRFGDCMDWWQVADEIGGGNTGDSVKKKCYRYLDERNRSDYAEVIRDAEEYERHAMALKGKDFDAVQEAKAYFEGLDKLRITGGIIA